MVVKRGSTVYIYYIIMLRLLDGLRQGGAFLPKTGQDPVLKREYFTP